jgi:hypothetical protein
VLVLRPETESYTSTLASFYIYLELFFSRKQENKKQQEYNLKFDIWQSTWYYAWKVNYLKK